MEAGRDARTGKSLDLISVFEGVGQRAAGQITDERLLELERQSLSDLRLLLAACSPPTR